MAKDNGKRPVGLILASNSPRRKQLLRLAGWDFRIVPADVDETPLDGEPADSYVRRIADEKARAVAPKARDGEVIVAADTTVADEGRILGKPQDAGEAFEMLARLRGRTHQVYTAVVAYQPSTDRMVSELAATDVPMRAYSREEINAYIATGDPFDKAGSYAIQHPEFQPVNELTGCYANVVGLPLCHLERAMRTLGTVPGKDIPSGCQTALAYACMIYPQVQKGEI